MLLLPPRRRGGVSGSSDGGGFIHWPGFTPPQDDDGKDDGENTPPVPDDPDDDNDNDDGDDDKKEPVWPDVGATYPDQEAGVIGNTIYTKTEDGVELTSVPATIEGKYRVTEQVVLDKKIYNITGFGSGAFTKPGGLNSVSVPASLCNIGSGLNAALMNYTSVKSVEIRSSHIGAVISTGAFQNNKVIVSVGLVTGNAPKGEGGVTKIEQDAFKDCTNLTTIYLTKGITIEEGAFSGCSSLQSSGVFYAGTEDDWQKLKEENKIDSNLPEPGSI